LRLSVLGVNKLLAPKGRLQFRHLLSTTLVLKFNLLNLKRLNKTGFNTMKNNSSYDKSLDKANYIFRPHVIRTNAHRTNTT
jgi:hypothetical protein